MGHKDKLNEYIIFPVCISLMIILILKPENISSGIYDGIMICFNILIPSLFPFTVLSVFIINLGILEKFNKRPVLFSCAIFFTSLIGGYPIGAKIIETANKNKVLNNHDADTLLYFCINGGPAFIITAIGKMILNLENIGLYLFSAHFLAAATLFIFNIKKVQKIKISANTKNQKSLSTKLVESVATASFSMLNICSYVILFSGAVKSINSNLIIGLLEVSNGVLRNNNLYVISFILGFSGFCIILQIISIGKEFISSVFKLIFYRILHGCFSVLYLKLILIIFPIKLETITNVLAFNYKYVTQNTLSSFIVIFFVIVFLYSLTSKKYCGKIFKDIW